MIERQRKTLDACPSCRMNPTLCFCAQIPRLETRTRVSVLIHAKELKRTTNTGRLATLALVNSALYARGRQDDVFDPASILRDDEQTLLFFPSEDAVELSPSVLDGRPVHLIVPDGNWRQAAKVNTRYPSLVGVQRVKIASREPATHFLRKETTPEGMATLQAIAEALGVTEGSDARETLRSLYALKLARTLQGRGVKI